MSDPVFDPDADFAVVRGDTKGRCYEQDGAYFRADQSFWVDDTDPEVVWVLARRGRDGQITLIDANDLPGSNFSGAYADLTGKPTLGTAAAQNTTAFATATQGGKADTALQAASLTAAALNAMLALLPTSDPADGTYYFNSGVLTKGTGP